MSVKRILSYLGISLLLFSAVRGQDQVLTLSRALEQALENNYGLIISKADLQVAQINNNWGTAGRYPTIGFDASDNNNYELNDGIYTNRLSAGVGLNWVLFDGFRVNITKSRLENLEELRSGVLALQVGLDCRSEPDPVCSPFSWNPSLRTSSLVTIKYCFRRSSLRCWKL